MLSSVCLSVCLSLSLLSVYYHPISVIEVILCLCLHLVCVVHIWCVRVYVCECVCVRVRSHVWPTNYHTQTVYILDEVRKGSGDCI